MDKILFFSDVHGNMPAALALEKEIKRIKPDDIWFLGDAVGKGPESDKAVDWVRATAKHFIKGNWDDGIASKAYPNDKFYWDQIGEERSQWLKSLPFEDEILISGLYFRMVHGRPTDRLYQAYDTWEEMAEGFKSKISDRIYDGYICADSHMPYIRTCEKGYAINTGSVGNNLGIPKVHAVLVEGNLGSSEPGPVSFNIISIPYKNEESRDLVDMYPDLPRGEAFKNEVMTGVYSR